MLVSEGVLVKSPTRILGRKSLSLQILPTKYGSLRLKTLSSDHGASHAPGIPMDQRGIRFSNQDEQESGFEDFKSVEFELLDEDGKCPFERLYRV
jgi:hypothetical protein